MGSLTSRPQITPSVTTLPQVITPPPSVTVTADTASDTSTSDETTSTARAQNLLSRERSRFGTIQTSFRGLLGLSGNNAQRKTLLGE